MPARVEDRQVYEHHRQRFSGKIAICDVSRGPSSSPSAGRATSPWVEGAVPASQKSVSLRISVFLRPQYPQPVHFDLTEAEGGRMKRELVQGDCVAEMRKLADGE